MRFEAPNLNVFPSPNKFARHALAGEPVVPATPQTVAIEQDDAHTVLETDSGNPIVFDK